MISVRSDCPSTVSRICSLTRLLSVADAFGACTRCLTRRLSVADALVDPCYPSVNATRRCIGPLALSRKSLCFLWSLSVAVPVTVVFLWSPLVTVEIEVRLLKFYFQQLPTVTTKIQQLPAQLPTVTTKTQGFARQSQRPNTATRCVYRRGV